MDGNKHKSTAQQGKNKCKEGMYGNTFCYLLFAICYLQGRLPPKGLVEASARLRRESLSCTKKRGLNET
jgi:hypothetical protein